MKKHIKFIDLFAGIGGIRLGLEQALDQKGITHECVFTSEIKKHAINVLLQNNPNDKICGDITQIEANNIPDFDILCAGFPCQAFSSAGNRDGFADTRGTMFFEVERILKQKKPFGFILENVEGLINHDKGNTLKTIIGKLSMMGYHVSYRLLNAKNFGVPQDRKRVYIIGSLNKDVNLSDFEEKSITVKEIIESNIPNEQSPFISKLLSHYKVEDLWGKSIKDKRGGNANIHSWDLEIKGPLSEQEKTLLSTMMTERRKKKWASEWEIDWMDGMPLTTKQIKTFFDSSNLQEMLDHLTKAGYLKFEHPKKQVKTTSTSSNGISVTTTRREYDKTKEKGYNIVAGKLSFEVNKILDPNSIAPTLVATDMQKIYVPNGSGIRKLTLREGLRLFGYPEDFKFDTKTTDGFDLLGNTVVVPVIKEVATKLLNTL